MHLDINPDTRRRILTAADQLYEQDRKNGFPNVDAVRRIAKVNMNDAAAVMREWRRQQNSKAAPVPPAIPDAVQRSAMAGLEQLWSTAQDCANQNLRTAQIGWEQERAETETLCQQLSAAFDIQTQQANELQRISDELRLQLSAAEARCDQFAAEAKEQATLAQNAIARQTSMEVKVQGMEQRSAERNQELEQLHHELQRWHQKEEAARQRHDAELAQLREKLQSEQRSAREQAIDLAKAQQETKGLQDRLNDALAWQSLVDVGSQPAPSLPMNPPGSSKSRRKPTPGNGG
jgi:colicin import membrane protein